MKILESMGGVTEAKVKSACDGCAACCMGGGPLLRLADEHLIKTGKIPLKFLYTLRDHGAPCRGQYQDKDQA